MIEVVSKFKVWKYESFVNLWIGVEVVGGYIGYVFLYSLIVDLGIFKG